MAPAAKSKRASARGAAAARARTRLPTRKVRLDICSWIDGQFETKILTQLANPPTIAECSVWTCDSASGLVGVVCLARRIAYYAAVTGPNQLGWWRIGSVPKSVMP
jgi:hypothetical protein